MYLTREEERLQLIFRLDEIRAHISFALDLLEPRELEVELFANRIGRRLGPLHGVDEGSRLQTTN